MQTINLSPFQYSGVNLTGISLLSLESVTHTRKSIEDKKSDFKLNDFQGLRTEEGLLYDAIQLFAEGFQRLKDATMGDIRKVYCNDTKSWEHGISLNNFMKSVSLDLNLSLNFSMSFYDYNFRGYAVFGKMGSALNDYLKKSGSTESFKQ